MADPMQTHGMFSWSELYAANGDAMKRFYASVLGWTYDEMPMPQGAYPVIKAGDSGIGGVVAAGNGIKGWLPYVTVSDVEATVAKATAAGGKVLVPPMDIPTVGRIATLSDPEGTTFAVIKYAPRG